jgi:hypothetical protein
MGKLLLAQLVERLSQRLSVSQNSWPEAAQVSQDGLWDDSLSGGILATRVDGLPAGTAHFA